MCAFSPGKSHPGEYTGKEGKKEEEEEEKEEEEEGEEEEGGEEEGEEEEEETTNIHFPRIRYVVALVQFSPPNSGRKTKTAAGAAA